MRALAGLALAWVACSAAPGVVDASPPPPALGRVPYPQVSGSPLRFRWTMPPVNARLRVYIALGERSGCAPGLAGCVRLAGPVLIAEVPVHPSGTTQVEARWPAWLDGATTVYVQAAVATPARQVAVSPVWHDPILDPADDHDHDGLPAAQEHARSLRMDRADTDGGGTLDGQEVADGTRADLAGDDRGVESLCDNGIDDDSDGLPDCEDGDCSAGCVETDCGDQADEDFDGAIDCADDDCWGPDCVDHTLAWTTHGDVSSASFSSGWGRVHHFQGAARGRVVLFKGAEQLSCGWQGWTSFWSPGGPGAFSGRIFVDGACDVGSEVLPQVRPALWSRNGWYGVSQVHHRTWYRSSCGWPHVTVSGDGGPLLPPVPYGSCPGGVLPLRAWPDLDGDGFGMSEAVDLRGEEVDRRFFCGAVPPGFTTAGGDCDDLDPTWTPAAVILDRATACADLSPQDRDGDGVSPPVDPDDLDSRAWGQEVACGDGVDNDADSLVDCEDGDCTDGPGCAELSCADRADNDQDGLVDCADADCWGPSCNTSRVSWLMQGTLTGTWDWRLTSAFPWGGAAVDANDLVGRVRTVGPQGTNTCTWTARHAEVTLEVVTHYGRCSVYPVSEWAVTREEFALTPGCFVEEPDIGPRFPQPHDGPRPSLGWYGPMDVVRTEPDGVTRRLAGGPVLDGPPDATCSPTIRFYPDLDGDGFGVSDPTDLHGALGGLRYACGRAPAGTVAVGGDCDDQDPAWSPGLITRAPGVSCTAIRADDRDGDGAPAGVDRDDADGRVW